MSENDHLSGCVNDINVGFVEREATPRLLTKPRIQLHLSELSLSDTVFLEEFGVDRFQPIVRNWAHKGDLQPETGRRPNHVVVEETVTQLDDVRRWQYAGVDTDSNNLPQTRREPTRTDVIGDRYFAGLRDEHDDDHVFLVDSAVPLQRVCRKHGPHLGYERHENRNSVERVFREVRRRTANFLNCFSNAEAETADEWIGVFAFERNRLI